MFHKSLPQGQKPGHHCHAHPPLEVDHLDEAGLSPTESWIHRSPKFSAIQLEVIRFARVLQECTAQSYSLVTFKIEPDPGSPVHKGCARAVVKDATFCRCSHECEERLTFFNDFSVLPQEVPQHELMVIALVTPANFTRLRTESANLILIWDKQLRPWGTPHTLSPTAPPRTQVRTIRIFLLCQNRTFACFCQSEMRCLWCLALIFLLCRTFCEHAKDIANLAVPMSLQTRIHTGNLRAPHAVRFHSVRPIFTC